MKELMHSIMKFFHLRLIILLLVASKAALADSSVSAANIRVISSGSCTFNAIGSNYASLNCAIIDDKTREILRQSLVEEVRTELADNAKALVGERVIEARRDLAEDIRKSLADYIAIYRHATESKDTGNSVEAQQARLLAKAGDLAGAEDSLKKLADSQNQQAASTQNELGNLAMLQRKIREGAEFYRAASRLSPSNPVYSGNYASASFKMGMYQNAAAGWIAARDAYIKISDDAGAAYALNNLAGVYQRLGRWNEAIKSHIEARDIYTNLISTDSSKYGPSLAWTQNDLGNVYSDRGDTSKAEEQYKGALSIYQDLARVRRADVAVTLANLGSVSLERQDYKAAFTYYDRSCNEYSGLNSDYPGAYGPQLAWTLASRASALYHFRRPNETNDQNERSVEDGYKQAVSILRPLASSQPEAYSSDLAWLLDSQGAFLREVPSGLPGAEAAFLEALTLYKGLADRDAETPSFRREVAITENNLADIYTKTGQAPKAKQVLAEALIYYQGAVAADPQDWADQSQLAWTWVNLALAESKEPPTNKTRADEEKSFLFGLKIYCSLYKPPQRGRLSDVAWAVEELGMFYADSGHSEDAIKRLEQAFTLYKAIGYDKGTEFGWRQEQIVARLKLLGVDPPQDAPSDAACTASP